MGAGELLGVEPIELKFTFESKKQISCSLQLSNKNDDCIAFKFTKESGNKVDEVKLRVVYVAPPQPPSPVPEESEESSSPRASESEIGNMGPRESATARGEYVETQEKSSEVAAWISKLTEERNSAIQQSNKLRQELELVRREVAKRKGGGFSFMFVVLVVLLGIILGYLVQNLIRAQPNSFPVGSCWDIPTRKRRVDG